MTTAVQLVDPVAVKDIAERLGVKAQTVAQWRDRSRRGVLNLPFPEPALTVAERNIWEWPTVVAWAKATGRLR